jgi:chromatin segregation and condensation protein Rec8/ScpA/Scc1 (kleisin family)
VHSSSDLGDTAKLFEAIDEEELKKKLQETLEGMQNLFESNESNESNEPNNNENPLPNMPNAEQIHEHIQSMMGGKLGKLAMELAEETAEDLNLDMENTGDAKDVFQKLFKNPAKMMNMVKNIGSKIDEKIKSGELKESELMEEGMDLLNKMKDMPGMGDMQKIFEKMGIPGLGKGAKINMSAMEAQLNKNMKNAKMKERIRAKAEANAKAKASASTNTPINVPTKPTVSDEELLKIFSTGEKVEKTPRGAKPPGKKKGKK